MKPAPVNFTDMNDLEAVVLAQLGMSNTVIAINCPGLISHGAKNPHGRITYRLKKAAALFGLQKGQGFRSMWRNGTSPIAQDVMKGLVPKLRKQTKGFLIEQIIHPPVEAAKPVKEQDAPTAAEAARLLKEDRRQAKESVARQLKEKKQQLPPKV
jgi:hypothetical protein